jgi:urease gamma subunit
MEERKKRYEDKNEVRGRMAEVVKKLTAGATFFDGTHIFTPHSDVPDDGALRLVVLAPELFYSKEEPRLAMDGVLEYVRNNGAKPRYRGNRLLFLAPDHGALTRLRDCIRVALAWKSIVDDVAEMRLNLDVLQVEQAKKELKGAEDVLPRVARECYKWLLCPSQDNPSGKPSVETVSLNTSGAALGPEIERVCLDNEWVIATWSPIHLRTKLKELYWKPGSSAKKAAEFWEDTLRYLYLPRLKDRGVLAQAIVKGAGTKDFFGTAYGEHEGKFDGFKFGDSNVQFDDTLLLIEPTSATAYEEANRPVIPPPEIIDLSSSSDKPTGQSRNERTDQPTVDSSKPPSGSEQLKSFHGSADIAPATAKMRLVQIAEEVIAMLMFDPNAEVKVRIEIEAKFPNGAQAQTLRAVSENAKTLNFKTAEWEKTI